MCGARGKPGSRIDAVQRCKVPSRRSKKAVKTCADAIAAVGLVKCGEGRTAGFDEGIST